MFYQVFLKNKLAYIPPYSDLLIPIKLSFSYSDFSVLYKVTSFIDTILTVTVGKVILFPFKNEQEHECSPTAESLHK